VSASAAGWAAWQTAQGGCKLSDRVGWAVCPAISHATQHVHELRPGWLVRQLLCTTCEAGEICGTQYAARWQGPGRSQLLPVPYALFSIDSASHHTAIVGSSVAKPFKSVLPHGSGLRTGQSSSA
jgi:hypothetical protein